MKKYRLLKLPPESFWTMFHTYTIPQIEMMLCIIAQGYGPRLCNNIIYDYAKQGQGVYETLIKLIVYDEEIVSSY